MSLNKILLQLDPAEAEPVLQKLQELEQVGGDL